MVTTQTLYTPDEPELGYGQLLNILTRRIVWLGGAVAGGLGIAVVLTAREDPVFESSMRLLIEPNYRQTVDITQEGDPNQRSLDQIDYATQLNLMRSQGFIEQTVEELLKIYPDLCGDVDTVARCARQFQSNLSLTQIVEDDVDTRIFEVEFSGGDSEFVQVFLQTLSDVYLTYNVEQQEERLEQGLTLVNQQIDDVRASLTASRQRLKQFRENENLISPEQQAISVSNTLNGIEQNQIEVENEFRASQAQFAALQQQLAADPQTALTSSRLSQSSRYQQLLNALQETELTLEQRRAIYTDEDPGVQDLLSQRQGQIALLQEEVTRVLGEVPAQISLSEPTLLTEGQLGGIDLTLVNNLVQAEVELQSLTARRAGLAQAEQQLRTQLNEFPSLIAEFDRIQPEIETQQQALEQLLTIRQELSNELAQGGFTWEIVETPDTGRKVSPQPPRNLILGLIAGVFVGGALAFGREAIDNVVRTSDELKKQTTLPLLGVIPDMPAGAARVLPLAPKQSSAQAFSLVHYQPFRDAVDLVYKTIQLTSNQPLSSLMVTSALEGEGKTTLAIGLALTAARLHQRVLLIDMDLRQPSLHRQLGLSNERGLSTQIQAGQTAFSPTSLALAGTSIDVVTAGPTPDDPVRLLSSRSVQQLLAHAETMYDLIVVDTPAVLGSADVLQIGSLCKASIMVSRLDRITQADLTQAAAMLSTVNTVGIVASKYHGGHKSPGMDNSNDSSTTPPDGNQSLGSTMAQFVNGALSWRRLFTASSMGAGMAISAPLLPGSVSEEQQNYLPPTARPPGQAPVRSKSKYSQSNTPAAFSTGDGVTSLHMPQWS